jgi:hypothetical protein
VKQPIAEFLGALIAREREHELGLDCHC